MTIRYVPLRNGFVLTAIVGCLAVWLRGQSDVPPAVDFAKEIQPIFAKNCQGCHGAKMQGGGLRLDARTPAMAGGLSGPLLVAGNAKGSILYQRVAGLGDQARMPMGGKPLPPGQLALIARWIDSGAVWPKDDAPVATEVRKHWAFIPPERPAVPSGMAKNPVDAFILERLQKEGLSLSPEAGKTTLLRRLSLDVTGLPPTIDELNAFLADKSPQAYEKQVDRLLASPHYGERWGRIWLDAARYADSNGYEKDSPRSVWFYRDWVINALNRDLPYNQFVIEQIAGDLLPNAMQDQRVATGFLRNSMLNEEGGVDPEQFRMEAMYDRMDAIGKGILGVTIQCAQCHNHKYDPLTQEEYYRLFAFLNNVDEGQAAVYSPAQLEKRAEILRRTGEVENELRRKRPDWPRRMAAWEEQVKGSAGEWTVLRPEVDDISTGGSRYGAQSDGSFLAQGFAPAQHRVKFTVKTDVENITAFRLELLTDENLPCRGPGRSPAGVAMLSEFEVEAAPADDPGKPVKVKLASATADFEAAERILPEGFQTKGGERKMSGPVSFAIDGKDATAWTTDAGPGLRNQSRKAVFQPEKPVGFPKGTVLHFYLKQSHGGFSNDSGSINNIGRLRLSMTTTPGAAADPLPANVREILTIPAAKRSPAQVRAVFSHWRKTVPEWHGENEQIAALWREHPEGTTQLVLAARANKRETHILKRGDFLQPDRAVEPGVPKFLHQLPEGVPVDRLAFAKWLADRKSPTTARSIVNRVWQSYFGTGIVASSENFGTQCEPPSHPELLDWLAVEFMDSGWSLKKLHRLILTSATYRQSSQVTPELLSKDPANRLLARGPRFRVDGELVRDIALEASGLLNAKVGGPSVHPPAPAFLFLPPASYAEKTWKEEAGTERYRRALYTFRFRSVPYPMLQTFDAPNGDASCVRRTRSNTPLQALTALNEPLFVESAQALALRTLREGGGSDVERLNYAFRLCVSRQPADEEKSILLGLLDKQRKRLAEGWLSAADLSGFKPDEKPVLPQGATPRDWAAWTAVSRVLLNLDETVTKE